MDPDPNTVHVRSSFERPRGPAILVSAIAVFLALAILKPWSFGASSGGRPTPGPPGRPLGSSEVAAAPSPSSRPIEDPNGMLCLSGDTEQLVLLERWAGNEVRSWIVATDRPVSGPLDPAMARIAVFSSHVIGIGICAPQAFGGSVAAGARLDDVQVVAQDGHGPKAGDLGRPDPITITTGSPDAAVLYGWPQSTPTDSGPAKPSLQPTPAEVAGPTPPAFGPGPTATPWPPGSYAIAFVFPADPSARVRWVRLDILDSATPSTPG